MIELVLLSLGGEGVRIPPSERPLKPVEVAKYFSKCLNQGETRGDLAKACRISAGMINKFLALLTLPENLQAFVDWGRAKEHWVGFSAATEISKFPSSQQKQLIETSMQLRLSKSEVVSIRQLEERSDSSVDEAIQRVVGRRPTKSTIEIWIAPLPADLIKSVSSLLQAERDSILAKALFTTLNHAPQAKLGDRALVIVGNKDLVMTVSDPAFKDSLWLELSSEINRRGA